MSQRDKASDGRGGIPPRAFDDMNKRLVILVDNLYEDLEVWYPKIFFEANGDSVTIAGREARKIYRGKNGYPVESQVAIKNLKPVRFDAVIIPGGFAPDYLRRYPETLTFVKAMDEKKTVAAICHAGWVLISAGIVRGRKITGYYAIHDDLRNAGAKLYPDKPVMVDGNLITSRSPADLPFFCQAITEAFVR